MSFDPSRARDFIDGLWDDSIVPALVEYIRIPNKSPAFDARWAERGHMDRAVELVAGWLRAHQPAGATVEVLRLQGRTPLIWVEIPGSGAKAGETVLLYGHLDKQPEMSGWSAHLGPWQPVIEGDRLYGRGGADDGYSAFAALTAVNAVRAQGGAHARCVMLVEACEESGSQDLPVYIEQLADRIGTPSLIVCLDSGCGNYDQLWATTSLRGYVGGTLRVELLRCGVHSGSASGLAASTFRVARMLLDRVEDAQTGAVGLKALQAPIPAARIEQAKIAATALGGTVAGQLPWVEGARPVADDPAELILNGTWRSTLSVTGAGGLPPVADAGNVLRPFTELKLSFRLPPTVDPAAAYEAIKAALERDPPYGARVTFQGEHASGWDAPALAPWLEQAADAASRAFFGRGALYIGEGGSIPFMNMLGARFPRAQFLITGVLGPDSNAHGPDEFLHLPYVKRLTGCIASILAHHGGSARRGRTSGDRS